MWSFCISKQLIGQLLVLPSNTISLKLWSNSRFFSAIAQVSIELPKDYIQILTTDV